MNQKVVGFILPWIIFLSACSGGSSDSGGVVGSDEATRANYNAERVSKGALTIDNAPDVVLDLTRLFNFFLFRYSGREIAVTPDQYVDTSLPASEASSEHCSVSGGVAREFDAPSQLTTDAQRLLGVGDTFTLVADNCVNTIFSTETFTVDGGRFLEVLEGSHSFLEQDPFTNPTKIFVRYRDFAVTLLDELIGYIDGEFVETYSGNGVFVESSDEVIIKDFADGFPVEGRMNNFALRVERYEGLAADELGYQVSLATPMTIELPNSGIKVEVDLTTPLRINDYHDIDIGEGTMEIRSDAGVIKVSFSQYELEYSVDAEEDSLIDLIGALPDYLW